MSLREYSDSELLFELMRRLKEDEVMVLCSGELHLRVEHYRTIGMSVSYPCVDRFMRSR